MSVTAKKVLLIILTILLVSEIGVIFLLTDRENKDPVQVQMPEIQQTQPPTEAPETEAPTETAAPTEPPVTEPGEQHYTLSFAGDCTFGSIPSNWNNSNHFVKTIGENYDYPFDNVRHILENDDFTIINLEGPLTDSTSGAASKRFSFRGPTAYVQIMTGSSVEAVTLANNHAEDYGKSGYDSTRKVLEEAGITYVEKNKTAMYTTESGLKIGLYAGTFDFSESSIKNGIAQLRKDGAEIVICAFHWGIEGSYRPNSGQQKFAKVAIDAGADVVYGHHPHVLQKIETYKDKYIFYSLSNFSFGGAALPGDYDTALVQLDVIRDETGKVRLGELTIIPCSISSSSKQNNFQPTPLEEGTDRYNRVLSKLDGSFNGPDLVVDYSKLDPKPEETTPPASQPSGGETPAPGGDGGSSGGETPAPAPGGDSGSSGGETPAPAPGGDGGSSGGETPAPAPGGDSGSSGGENPAPAPGGDGGE